MSTGQDPTDSPGSGDPGPESEQVPATLAQQVLAHRTASGFSQQELAERSGVSRSVIARIETGVTLPTIPTLRAIAEACGVELHVALGEQPGQQAVEESSVNRIKVFVADSQALFTEALANALSRFPDFDIRYVRAQTKPLTGVETADAVSRAKPDVLLLDYWLADMDGATATRAILGWTGQTKVLLLAWLYGPDHIRRALQAGAHGFLPKSIRLDDLADAIRSAHRGDPLVHGEQLAQMMTSIDSRKEEEKELWRRVESLTPREIDVLRVLSSGRPAAEVAEGLSITTGTLRRHLEHIMSKTGATSRMEAISMVRRAGLIQS